MTKLLQSLREYGIESPKGSIDDGRMHRWGRKIVSGQDVSTAAGSLEILSRALAHTFSIKTITPNLSFAC